MYNVLLVDDEALGLEGLIKLVPWEDLGLQVIGAVYSGFEALKVIEGHHVDLLVSDIKMPIMSGLTLFDEAKKKLPCLKSVFISGYQDFEYAQEAIRMKASGYVLKPVDDGELIEVIQNVVRQIEEERASHQMKKIYNQSIPYLENQVISELLEGSFNESTITTLLDRCNIHWKHKSLSVAVVEIDNLQLKLSKYLPQERKEILSNIVRRITTQICTQKVGRYYKTTHHKIAIILEGSAEEAQQRLMQLVNLVEIHSEFTITIGMGRVVNDIHGIEESYKQAEKALQHKMFLHKQNIIRVEDITEKTVKELGDFNNLLSSLFNAVAAYDLKQIDSSLSKLFCFIGELQDKMTVYTFLVSALFEFEVKLISMNENLYQIIGNKLQYLNELFQFETMEALQTWLSDKMYKVAESLYKKKQRPNYKLIVDVIEYIEGNLGERLTLQEVADHFAFSPNYLGYIFKEEMTENFSNFLINKRIEKACELLRDTRMKVYEIADAVGYKNLTYFSRQFKENMGVTPGDYRKECGGQESCTY